MNTFETFRAAYTADRPAAFAARRIFESNVDKLHEIYRDTCSGSPAGTVSAFVDAVGHDAAAAVIASLVDRHNADGRISPRNVAWARTIPAAWDRDAMVKFSLYSKIHLAHLDQIADEMRKRCA